jgi:Zn-dependent M16 (insulinase) family peptidase
VEPQPKFDEIEERFESEFANLTLIEDMIIQDQKRKTLMFQFEHELEKEKRRLESELRRKSIVKEKKDRLSIMSDIGSITAGNNRRDNIGTVSIADTIKLTDKKFKKTIRMQETLRNRFENSVLDLVVDYLRRVDRRPFVQVRGNT